MPGSGGTKVIQGAVGGARHKFKKEPGVPNSDDEDGLEKDCDEIKVKSKACSGSETSANISSSPSSSSNSARGKSSTCASEVIMKHLFVFLVFIVVFGVLQLY